MTTCGLVFDIAMPVCGQAEFLPTALASIAAQRVNVQLALLDATPDDSVQRVLSENRCLSFAYVRHAPDAGQASAIQEGWDQLSGDVVCWLNADDYLLPGSLDAVEQVFSSRPDVDVVYGDSIFVGRGGEFISYFPAISENISDIVAGCSISQPACFVRREAVAKIGGLNAKLHYIMDWDLWTRLYLSGARFVYLKRPLAAVRMYPQTKTASGGMLRFREIRTHLRAHAGLIKSLKSTIGCLSDSMTVNAALWQKVLRGIVVLYGRAKLSAFRAFHKDLVKRLYGIEVPTGRVYGEASLWLPWYEKHQANQLTVLGRNMEGVTVGINGIPITGVSLAGLNGKLQAVTCAVPAELSEENLFVVRLRSATDAPWFLLSAQLQ
jgi:glycosyltransferase involved in cell wall biosynthesis